MPEAIGPVVCRAPAKVLPDSGGARVAPISESDRANVSGSGRDHGVWGSPQLRPIGFALAAAIVICAVAMAYRISLCSQFDGSFSLEKLFSFKCELTPRASSTQPTVATSQSIPRPIVSRAALAAPTLTGLKGYVSYRVDSGIPRESGSLRLRDENYALPFAEVAAGTLLVATRPKHVRQRPFEQSDGRLMNEGQCFRVILGAKIQDEVPTDESSGGWLPVTTDCAVANKDAAPNDSKSPRLRLPQAQDTSRGQDQNDPLGAALAVKKDLSLKVSNKGATTLPKKALSPPQTGALARVDSIPTASMTGTTPETKLVFRPVKTTAAKSSDGKPARMFVRFPADSDQITGASLLAIQKAVDFAKEHPKFLVVLIIRAGQEGKNPDELVKKRGRAIRDALVSEDVLKSKILFLPIVYSSNEEDDRISDILITMAISELAAGDLRQLN